MKVTMLGTAAIGYPLAFCNCDNCKLARTHKGKSIRKRASILINDDLMIDLGPDSQTAMTMYDKDMGKVKYLLQTHIHIDHFDEGLLISRIPYMAMQGHYRLEIYATDTPDLTEEALEQLAEYKLDLVIMDHTFGNVEYSFSHLNEKKFVEQINRMKERNIIGENTLIYGTHISHDGMLYHEEAERKAGLFGYHIAWDGMEVEV